MTDMPQERHVLVPSSHSRASFLFALNIHFAQHPSRTPCHGVKKKIMKIALQERDSIDCVTTILCMSFFPMHPAMKIPDAQAAVGQECEKRNKFPAWQTTKVNSKRRGHQRGTEGREDSSFFYTKGHMPSQKLGVGTQVQKYKGRVVLRGDIVKDDSGSYAAFTKHGPSSQDEGRKSNWR